MSSKNIYWNKTIIYWTSDVRHSLLGIQKLLPPIHKDKEEKAGQTPLFLKNQKK